MCAFIQATLKPEIFWNALASIGTFLAIAVALAWPLFNQYLRNNRIERLLKAEIRGNLKIISSMTAQEFELPGGHKISAAMHNDGLVKHIDLRLWQQFRYELAGERPESFDELSSVNMQAENIINASAVPDQIRIMMQCDAAKSYALKCRELGIT